MGDRDDKDTLMKLRQLMLRAALGSVLATAALPALAQGWQGHDGGGDHGDWHGAAATTMAIGMVATMATGMAAAVATMAIGMAMSTITTGTTTGIGTIGTGGTGMMAGVPATAITARRLCITRRRPSITRRRRRLWSCRRRPSSSPRA